MQVFKTGETNLCSFLSLRSLSLSNRPFCFIPKQQHDKEEGEEEQQVFLLPKQNIEHLWFADIFIWDDDDENSLEEKRVQLFDGCGEYGTDMLPDGG